MKTKGEAWAESMASELKQKKKINKKKINIQKANNMGYKQGPFPMIEGTSSHKSASVLKDKGNSSDDGKMHNQAHGTNHTHPPGTSFAVRQKIRKKRAPAEKKISKEQYIQENITEGTIESQDLRRKENERLRKERLKNKPK